MPRFAFSAAGDGGVEALLTDVDMPGSMNGLELARCVHGNRRGYQ